MMSTGLYLVINKKINVLLSITKQTFYFFLYIFFGNVLRIQTFENLVIFFRTYYDW